MRIILLFIIILITAGSSYSKGLHVYGLGLYDVKFDGSSTDQALDLRYENRLDKVLFDIGPKEDNFFFLKPFYGIEITSDSATYIASGIYLEDNIGDLLKGEENKLIFTPSLGIGYYDDGSGKKLGYNIQFRTTFEISYELKNNSRIGFSFGHISNANLGNKNPGVEIFSISYQIPY
tara:strand:+ start:98 stop:628 length:531 start_codon:yes stop_codon:yes gene_type:complete